MLFVCAFIHLLTFSFLLFSSLSLSLFTHPPLYPFPPRSLSFSLFPQQIIEHTEFVEDGTLQPFQSSRPYHKRCMQQKISSGGQVQYIHPNQLVVPEEYSNVGTFPDKFVVDGFIVCIDVSADLDDPKSQQREFLSRLLPAVFGMKRVHTVIALTKYDIAREPSIAAANEILAKFRRQLTVIEVSALKGVNVDVCFLVLAHLVDSKRPRTRISTFGESFGHLKDRIRRNEETFQLVLDERILDFCLPLSKARALVENEVEFLLLQELCGKDRVNKLIKAKLNYLKEIAVKKKLAQFSDFLRISLELFLPNLSLQDNLQTCRDAIESHTKFLTYFYQATEDWRENFALLKDENVAKVPVSFFDEPEGKKVIQEYIDKVKKELCVLALV